MSRNRTKAIYLAGKSEEAPLVRSYIEKVRALGFIITLDWTVFVGDKGAASNEGTREERLRSAMQDVQAVERADIVWLLYPESGTSAGASFETGYARALKKCVIVSGGGRRRTIFSELASVQYETHEVALEALKNWASMGAVRT